MVSSLDIWRRKDKSTHLTEKKTIIGCIMYQTIFLFSHKNQACFILLIIPFSTIYHFKITYVILLCLKILELCIQEYVCYLETDSTVCNYVLTGYFNFGKVVKA